MQQLNENLYSRQLAVYGAETQAKLMQMRCFLYGLKGLGIEIAKNLILAGPAELTIFDNNKVEVSDLASNFYCNQSHVNRATRQEACIQQLSELNPNVKVIGLNSQPSVEEISNFNVVIITDCWNKDYLIQVNEATRKKRNGFIYSHCSGLFGSAFVDYGDEFEVFDQNGEQVKSTIVAGITKDADGIVSGDEKKRHGFQDGDYVTFKEVQGMTQVNGQLFKIKVVSPFTFSIGDTTKFSDYQREGICEQVKVPVKVQFKSFAESLLNPHAPGRQEMDICDWEKMDRPEILHKIFNLILENQFPSNENEFQALLEKTKSKDIQDTELLAQCAKFGNSQISPMVSFWGGIVAQEVVKWTGKFNPLRQWLHHEFFEALPEGQMNHQLRNSRYDPYLSLFGEEVIRKIQESKIFMVGAGALGCEYIKMFSLMGIGQLVVTDDDNIEMSNLNRQFLFRKKDVGKNKAECACKIGREMNKDCKIENMGLRVGPKSENVFNDEFWESLSMGVNAVDNVYARRYIDDKCCYYSKALFESGTLGTKCNSQLILPFKTQSYSESQDPPEEGIPLCTLKNFPYQIEHTIQWARDYFEGIFVEGSLECSNYLQDSVNYLKRVQKEFKDQPSVLRGKLEVLKSYLDIGLNKNYDKCVEMSRNLFEDIFKNQIDQLLYCFPLDHKTQEGNLFWTNPKRPPNSLLFDENDQEHLNFVQSCANIFGYVFDLPYENNRNNLKKILKSVKVQEFKVKNVVLKENEQDKREEKSEDDEEQIDKLIKELNQLKLNSLSVNKVEFEKDDPTNWHIDFVSSVANLRARNYTIKEVSAFQVKLIAGKIIPALATTTAMIVGAVGIEILKFIQQKDLEKMRNAFINLGLPLFLFSQPLPPTQHQDYENSEIYLGPVKAVPQKWTAWDRILIKGPMKIKQFIEHFKQNYNVEVSSIIYGQIQLYTTYPKIPVEILDMDVSQVIQQKFKLDIPKYRKFIDLIVGGDYISDPDKEQPSADIAPVKYQYI